MKAFNKPSAECKIDDVEECWNKLKKLLLGTTQKVCGKMRGRPHCSATWWWDKRVNCAIKEKRQLWKDWEEGKCSKQLYTDAKQSARRQVCEAKIQAAKQQFGSLSTTSSKNNAFCVDNCRGNTVMSSVMLVLRTMPMNWSSVMNISLQPEMNTERLLNQEFPCISHLNNLR